MIKGTGIDIAEISRFEQLVEKYGSRFIAKVFTPGEIAFCSSQARPAVHYAGRWAAKEAFYKALNSDCQEFATWQSIEILPCAGSRRPAITIIKPALGESLADHGVSVFHVSISHEKNYCVATVVLE